MNFAINLGNDNETKKKAEDYLAKLINEDENIKNKGDALRKMLELSQSAEENAFLKEDGVDTKTLDWTLKSLKTQFVDYGRHKKYEHRAEMQDAQDACNNYVELIKERDAHIKELEETNKELGEQIKQLEKAVADKDKQVEKCEETIAANKITIEALSKQAQWAEMSEDLITFFKVNITSSELLLRLNEVCTDIEEYGRMYNYACDTDEVSSEEERKRILDDYQKELDRLIPIKENLEKQLGKYRTVVRCPECGSKITYKNGAVNKFVCRDCHEEWEIDLNKKEIENKTTEEQETKEK